MLIKAGIVSLILDVLVEVIRKMVCRKSSNQEVME